MWYQESICPLRVKQSSPVLGLMGTTCGLCTMCGTYMKLKPSSYGLPHPHRYCRIIADQFYCYQGLGWVLFGLVRFSCPIINLYVPIEFTSQHKKNPHKKIWNLCCISEATMRRLQNPDRKTGFPAHNSVRVIMKCVFVDFLPWYILCS